MRPRETTEGKVSARPLVNPLLIPEYLMEAAGLCAFMISACSFAIVLFHPASPLVLRAPDPLLRRVLMGLAMGSTAILLVYSPWGRQSGAHLNPSVTLTFWCLGKDSGRHAAAYAIAQCIGGLLGVFLMARVFPAAVAVPTVNYVVTMPGEWGPLAAFATELLLSFVMMASVLWTSNSRHARWTGVVAGSLVAANISLAAPLSGMSMNPARSLASAIPAQVWTGLWIYFTAPPSGMLLAAALFVRLRRVGGCAKLYHASDKRCIFCGYEPTVRSPVTVPSGMASNEYYTPNSPSGAMPCKVESTTT